MNRDDIVIQSALVDGQPFTGKFDAETLKLLPYEVFVSGRANDIAARIGWLCGLKVMRGETKCKSATIIILLRGKEFAARYTQENNGWYGKFLSEDDKKAIMKRVQKRIKEEDI